MSEEPQDYEVEQQHDGTLPLHEVLGDLGVAVNQIIVQLDQNPNVDKRWLRMASEDLDRGFMCLLRSATFTPPQNDEKAH